MKLIEPLNLETHGYTRGEFFWLFSTLIEASKDLDVFKLPVAGIDIGVWPWETTLSIKNFADHMSRCLKGDPDYPVILDDFGYVCDGWHRVVTAIVNGEETIWAKRLLTMPVPDRIEEDEEIVIG